MRKWLALALLCCASSAWASGTLPVTIQTHDRSKSLTLELATTAAEREQGLMDRDRLAPADGMLFVFPRTKRLAFWMKNTRIPLDILFIDDKGTIRHIATGTKPLSLEPIDSTAPTKSVIEIAGGRAVQDGIHEGDQVSYTLPAGSHVE